MTANTSLLKTILLFATFLLCACSGKTLAERQFEHFLKTHDYDVSHYENLAGKLQWECDSAQKSFSESYKKNILLDSIIISKQNKIAECQSLINSSHSDVSDFTMIKNLYLSGEVKDPVLNRQLKKLFLCFFMTQSQTSKFDLESLDAYEQLKSDLKKMHEYRANQSLRNQTDSSLFYQKRWDQTFEKYLEYDSISTHETMKSLGYTYEDNLDFILPIFDLNKDELELLVLHCEQQTRDIYKQICSEIIGRETTSLSITQKEFANVYRTILLENREFAESKSPEELVKVLQHFAPNNALDMSDIIEQSSIWNGNGSLSTRGFVKIGNNSNDYRIFGQYKPNLETFKFLVAGQGVVSSVAYVDEDIVPELRHPNNILTVVFMQFITMRLSTFEAFNKGGGLELTPPSELEQKYPNCSLLLNVRMLCLSLDFMLRYQSEVKDAASAEHLMRILAKKHLGIETGIEALRLRSMLTDSMDPKAILPRICTLYGNIGGAQLEACSANTPWEDLTKDVFRYGNSKSFYEVLELTTGEKLSNKYLIDKLNECNQLTIQNQEILH